jgi:hypothetical protein
VVRVFVWLPKTAVPDPEFRVQYQRGARVSRSLMGSRRRIKGPVAYANPKRCLAAIFGTKYCSEVTIAAESNISPSLELPGTFLWDGSTYYWRDFYTLNGPPLVSKHGFKPVYFIFHLYTAWPIYNLVISAACIYKEDRVRTWYDMESSTARLSYENHCQKRSCVHTQSGPRPASRLGLLFFLLRSMVKFQISRSSYLPEKL